MYDGHHDDWARDDAEHACQQEYGCGNCDDIKECRQEGACIKHLEIVEPDSGTRL